MKFASLKNKPENSSNLTKMCVKITRLMKLLSVAS